MDSNDNHDKPIFSVYYSNYDLDCGWSQTKAEHLTYQQALDVIEQDKNNEDSYWFDAAYEPSGGIAVIYNEEEGKDELYIDIPSIV